MRRLVSAAALGVALWTSAALAQVPVVDGATNQRRSEDKDHSTTDVDSKTQQQKARKGVRCNLTQQGGAPAKAQGKAGSAGVEGSNSVKTAVAALPAVAPAITNVGGSVVSGVAGYSGGLSSAIEASTVLLRANAPVLGTDVLLIAAWGSNQAVRTQGAQLTNEALSAVNLMVQLLSLRGEQDLVQQNGGAQFMAPGAVNPFSGAATACDANCAATRALAATQATAALAAQKKALEARSADPIPAGPDTSSDSGRE
jgi:hypothetical protein